MKCLFQNSLLGCVSDGYKWLDAHTSNLEYKMLPAMIEMY